MRQRRRGADVQPIGQRRRVPKRTQPEAVAHGVPNVVRRHGDEKHPGQRAPGVFEAPEPHEETEAETEDGNERGAVERRTLGEGDGGLEDAQYGQCTRAGLAQQQQPFSSSTNKQDTGDPLTLTDRDPAM